MSVTTGDLLGRAARLIRAVESAPSVMWNVQAGIWLADFTRALDSAVDAPASPAPASEPYVTVTITDTPTVEPARERATAEDAATPTSPMGAQVASTPGTSRDGGDQPASEPALATPHPCPKCGNELGPVYSSNPMRAWCSYCGSWSDSPPASDGGSTDVECPFCGRVECDGVKCPASEPVDTAEMRDLCKRLRGLSAYEHSDCSVGAEAADMIERLRPASEPAACPTCGGLRVVKIDQFMGHWHYEVCPTCEGHGTGRREEGK